MPFEILNSQKLSQIQRKIVRFPYNGFQIGSQKNKRNMF